MLLGILGAISGMFIMKKVKKEDKP